MLGIISSNFLLLKATFHRRLSLIVRVNKKINTNNILQQNEKD